MSAPAPSAAERSLLDLVAASQQVEEWRQEIDRLRTVGHRLALAHSPDRRAASRPLVGRAHIHVPLTGLDRLPPVMRRGDLLLILSSPAAGPTALTAGAELHRLLHQGIRIWGITGPRPNRWSPYCHDSISVPESDPSFLMQSHCLIVGRLADPDPGPLGGASPSRDRRYG